MNETVTVKEIAKARGITTQAVMIRANKENWPHEKINKRGDRRFYIDKLPEHIRMAVMALRINNKLPALMTQGALPERAMVNPPGYPFLGRNHTPAFALDELRRGKPVPVGAPLLRDWQIKKASAWADLVSLYLGYVRKKANGHGSVMKAKREFVLAYNAKAYPTIYEILGKTSYQTLERQICKLKKGNDPLTAFAPHHGGHKGKRCINHDQAEIIYSIIRSPYQPKKKSEIIRIARAVMKQKGLGDGYSDATYRRFLDEWIETHWDQWNFWRGGEKALHNNCIYWIERDYDKLEVGDILVADGHKLNFETLNPWTGKPKRMTLILWYDMKSNYPCGWEIMPTEDTQAINSALRRAILMLGKIPKIAYLDNGKAFSSRFFNGMNLEEAGFSGVFDRLNIHPIYAWPYHPQSKTVERLFGTFAELERIAPSYVGTSINEKPPRLHMGEKLHRRIHEKITGGRVPTIEETHRAVAAWFDAYAARLQQGGHLKGIKPKDVFLEGRGPGVDRKDLCELMMSMEIRTIRARGIKLPWGWYYHPALYGRKHKVIIRYDLQDKDSILIYKDEEFLCEAPKVGKVHPAAEILGNDEDKALLKDEIALKKSQLKQTVSTAREFVETVVIPEVTKQISDAGFDLGAQRLEASSRKPEKVKELPLTEEDKARIHREFEALEREHQAMDHISWESLHKLNDMDRYEKLLEYDAQGVLIPKDEQAFMKYFEQTAQYNVSMDYFIEYRNKMTMVYQTN